MRLSSVRSLKEEYFSVSAAMVDRLATSTAFSTFSARRATARRIMNGVALGVTLTKKRDYQLAIRLQRAGPLEHAMTEELTRRAKGEVNVREIGTIVKFQGPTSPLFYQQSLRPLRIGASIGDVPPPGFIAAGTLGAFVVRRSSPRFLGILSNNHVIANENANALGSSIAQPGTLDGGEFPDDEVGALGRVIRLNVTGANQVDAAVADLWEGIDYDARTIGNLGNLAGQADVFSLPEKAIVHKVGRTTGQTKGRITAFDIDNIRVEYDLGVLKFDNQIEIEGTGSRAFSDSGDSGSLIVDDNLRAVGLLFAGGDTGGTNGKGLTYANPIEVVLDALKVDLEI